MRTFVKDGPTFPYQVLQAHEEEKVVFFCGAGISYYTGLPGFKELVRDTFKKCGHPLPDEKQAAKTPEGTAFYTGQFDQALHLLEDLVGRQVARSGAIEILSRPLKRGSGHLSLHKALLNLAEMRDGGYRLVTTNFDDRFSKANPRLKLTAEAPRLGWPRPGAWRHLTYLHGRIDRSDPSGEDLILSSGDFGRAYLSEGWASRFVVELFREYTVLFVGYSLNDPVLRYMMDALATEMRNGRFRKPFVLAPYKDGDRNEQIESWQSRGVEPIPFSSGPDGNNFSRQDESLILWAEHHKGGLDSRIATAIGGTRYPYVKTLNDYELWNAAWALSKEDGSVARAFADADPEPDISWLEPLSALRLAVQPGKGDVNLFQLPSPPPRSGDEDGYHVAPLAGQNAACIPGLPLARVTEHLGRWLTRHRTSLQVVDWIIEHQGIIHPFWRDRLADGLEDIEEPWRSFWQLLTDSETTPPCVGTYFVDHKVASGFRQGQWLDGAKQAIMRACRSWVRPEKPLFRDEHIDNPERMSQFVNFTLQLANPYLISEAIKYSDAQEIRQGLSRIADMITSRLVEALDLANRAEVADAISYTELSLPALDERSDVSAISEWTHLVYLLIEALKSLNELSPASALTLSARLRDISATQQIPLTQRIAVFAMTEVHPLPSARATDFLLSDQGCVLWDRQAIPEVMRFLRLRVQELDADDQQRIVAAVTSGPARELFPDFSGTDAEFQSATHKRQMALATQLLKAGIVIPPAFRQQIEAAFPRWATDELPVQRPIAEAHWVAPPTANDLLELSPEEICNRLVQESGWDGGHKLADLLKRNLGKGLDVILLLAVQDVRADTWEIGLSPLGELKNPVDCQRAIETLFELARGIPNWINGPGVRPVARFLYSLANTIENEHEALFFDLWDIAFTGAEISGKCAVVAPHSPVEEAINAPGGNLAQAFLDRLFSINLKIASGIPGNFAPRLDSMWNGTSDAHRHARIILASRVLWLHQLDPAWTRQTVISAMGTDQQEARELWSAMLWPAQWDIELVTELEPALQSILPKMHDGPENFAKSLSEWVTSILISAPQILTDATITHFFDASNARSLRGVVSVCKRSLENAGKQAADLWANRIRRIFADYWPADRGKTSVHLSEALLRMALATREAFPDVIDTLKKKDLIIHGCGDDFVRDLNVTIRKDQIYDYLGNHSEAVMAALHLSVDESLAAWNREPLDQILTSLGDVAPVLKRDQRMVRLRQIVAQG